MEEVLTSCPADWDERSVTALTQKNYFRLICLWKALRFFEKSCIDGFAIKTDYHMKTPRCSVSFANNKNLIMPGLSSVNSAGNMNAELWQYLLLPFHKVHTVKFKNQLMIECFAPANLDYHGNQQTSKRRKKMDQNLPITTHIPDILSLLKWRSGHIVICNLYRADVQQHGIIYLLSCLLLHDEQSQTCVSNRLVCCSIIGSLRSVWVHTSWQNKQGSKLE